jgi:hypothetical protein
VINTYFLVTGTVMVTPYLSEGEAQTDMRLVIAKDMDEASRKWMAYWESKSIDYGILYEPLACEVAETVI